MQGLQKQHMVRFACNPGHEKWSFWLDLAEHSQVELQVALSVLEHTDDIKAFVQLLPSWASEVAVTTFQSSWIL